MGPHPVLFGADFPWCWGWDRVTVCGLLPTPEHLFSRATASCVALVLALSLRQGLVLLWNPVHLSYVPQTHSERRELTPKSFCLGKVDHAFNPNTRGLQRQLDPWST